MMRRLYFTLRNIESSISRLHPLGGQFSFQSLFEKKLASLRQLFKLRLLQAIDARLMHDMPIGWDVNARCEGGMSE